MDEARGVDILFDECLSPKLVQLLLFVGEKRIRAMANMEWLGIHDDEWIPKVSALGIVYVTLDFAQRTTPMLSELMAQHQTKAIYLPARLSHTKLWDMALWFLKHWRAVRQAADGLAPGDVRWVRMRGQIVSHPPGRRRPTSVGGAPARTKSSRRRLPPQDPTQTSMDLGPQQEAAISS